MQRTQVPYTSADSTEAIFAIGVEADDVAVAATQAELDAHGAAGHTAGVSAPLYSRLAADSADVNASTTLVDSGLSVTVVAGATYYVRIGLFITTAAAADFDFKVVSPGADATGSLVAGDPNYAKVAPDVETLGGTTGAVADYPLTLDGVLTFPTGGTFKVQFAQNISDASNTHVDAGSFIFAQRLA